MKRTTSFEESFTNTAPMLRSGITTKHEPVHKIDIQATK